MLTETDENGINRDKDHIYIYRLINHDSHTFILMITYENQIESYHCSVSDIYVKPVNP